MRSLFRLLVRSFAFVRKEIFEILRQPRLILTLVLGPFLILLLFGIGYRNEARALRTLFVVERQDSPLAAQIAEYADSLGEQLIFRGVIDDEDEALRRLREQEVDLVAVAPPDAYDRVLNNEQAPFILLHNEIDPFQADYVNVFGRVYINEVNRRVLQTIADRGQQDALSSREQLANAKSSAVAMREALARGDVAAARQHQREMDRNLDALEENIGTSLNLLDGVAETLDAEPNPDVETLRADLSRAREASLQMGQIENGQDEYEEEVQQATEIESRLDSLDSRLGTFQQMNSRVLVSPFRSEVRSVASIQPQVAQYFAPAVIVLLLQHLAVTFAALSIIRDVQLGTIELFRVSPVSAGETLFGKYTSYLIFGAVLAAILTAVLVTPYALNVPMLGSWTDYALTVGALLFASLGYGFVISLIVDSDSQAVQYAMIVLLTSVFFSGFFLSIEAIIYPVRAVAWALPATYAILLLQDVMLRGNPASYTLLGALFGIGLLLFFVALYLLRRQLRNL